MQVADNIGQIKRPVFNAVRGDFEKTIGIKYGIEPDRIFIVDQDTFDKVARKSDGRRVFTKIAVTCLIEEFDVRALKGTDLSGLSRFVSPCPLQGPRSTTIIDRQRVNLTGLQTAALTLRNNLRQGLSVVVYGVVHNVVGQTVYYTITGVNTHINASAMVRLSMAGLPHANYSVTAYDLTPSGIAISPSETPFCSV